MKRRTLVAAGLTMPFANAMANANDSGKQRTFIVGYSAGGNVDNFARALGDRAGKLIKQPIIIDNKPGANEMIATQMVSRSEPDGRTILISTEAPITQSQFLYKKLSYVPEELTPIILLAQVPLVLVARSDLPVSNLKEFLAYAKKNPIIAGSAGIGGVTHLPIAMLAKMQGISWTHVPYKGSAAMFPDLISGRIDVCFTGSSAALSQIKAGKVKGLGVGTKERMSALPNVETFEENGLDGIGAKYTIGAYGPKGLPEEIRKQLVAVYTEVLKDPSFVSAAVTPNSYIVDGAHGSEFQEFLKKDRASQKNRVEASGAQLEG
ncbi:Bug family tripartite tricarboxylate transporter substrate binding protein [Ottowia sp. VDI28]